MDKNDYVEENDNQNKENNLKVKKELSKEEKEIREKALLKALNTIENRVEENQASKLERCLIF